MQECCGGGGRLRGWGFIGEIGWLVIRLVHTERGRSQGLLETFDITFIVRSQQV